MALRRVRLEARTMATDRLQYRDALASGELRALVGAQLISVGGQSVAAVALTVRVYRDTRSPLLASLTFALSFLPYLVGGGLLSGIVDRVRPRRLVVTCDATSALIVAAIAWPGLPLEVLFALLLASGTLSSLSGGTRAALVRASVPPRAYVPARSLMRIAAQVAQIAGNAGGGALLVVLSPTGSLLVSAAAYAASAGTVRLRVADHERSAGARSELPLLRDSLRGAREIFALAELRRLLVVEWLAAMFTVAPEALAAPYVAQHHGSSAAVGWFLVALPVGLIAGDFAGMRLLGARQQRRAFPPAAMASFLPYLVFAFGPPIPVAMALLVITGGCGLYVLGLDARVRDATPPVLFARTMTLNQAGLMALQGIGFTLAGAVGQALGPEAAVTAAGACGLAVTVALLGPGARAAGQAPAPPGAVAGSEARVH